jgi:hypothetical protein
MSDYTVVWSGELERKGLTFSLIGDRRYTRNTARRTSRPRKKPAAAGSGEAARPGE